MRKIITTFFTLIFVMINLSYTQAEDYLKIIPRSEWGADEQYRYWDSTYWADIFVKRAANSTAWESKWASYSQATKDSLIAKNKISSDKTNLMNSYLTSNFYDDIKIVEKQRYEGDNKLAWQYSRTNSVKNIVIHHTYTDYTSSAQGIKDIYSYHALSRQWGDIGYHYIIGYDGEVYEGRAGGDYVIASHDTWNNRSTVGISIMGNYDVDTLKDSQYASLKKLVSHLTKTYGIDLNTKIPYHKECFGENCTNGLETEYYFPIVGHRDGKSTSCPGDHNYIETIPRLLEELQPETAGYTGITYTEITAQKEEYQTYLNNRDWSKIKTTISKFDEAKQKSLIARLTYLSGREIGWKNKMLVKKVLEEIN